MKKKSGTVFGLLKVLSVSKRNCGLNITLMWVLETSHVMSVRIFATLIFQGNSNNSVRLICCVRIISTVVTIMWCLVV